MKTLKYIAFLGCTLTALTFPGSLHAEDHIESLVDTNGWDFRIGFPFWAAGADGTIGVRDREAHIDESFHDIADDLDFAAALNLEVRRCRWLLFGESMYLKTSEKGEPRIPGSDEFRQVEISQKEVTSDVGIGYAIMQECNLLLEPYWGARLTYVQADLSFSGPQAQLFRSQSRFWADPILGLRAEYALTPHVALYGKGDVGGFGWISDLTWQLEGGFDFNITRHFYTRLTYRYLSMDYSNGGFTYDIANGGPQIEIGVRF